jgi:asparagine synthase (glutamine-hydrolysing)
MPLSNGSGDIRLILSGEEFTSLSQQARNGNRIAADGSDHLLDAYSDSSTFLRSLNGRFHGLLIDRTKKVARLFNDRYGMHRIYWYESEEAFYFAAEAKAILAVCPETRQLDPRSLGEFVACGSVLENRSLFKGIRLLPAASDWAFGNGAVETKRTYFDPKEWEDQEVLDIEAYYCELRNVFSNSLPRYFRGDGPIAMSLTGGLDTRMIMAWSKAAPGSLPCYTFGGRLRECKDVTVARQIAEACGQSHHVITVGEEFLSRFSHYAERAVYVTDGCVDASRAPDLYLNEMAREIAPIRMTGNYGSEVLRGVRTFKAVDPSPGIFEAELLGYVEEAKQTYKRIAAEHPVAFAVFKQLPWHHYGILALEETQLSLRSPFLDNDLVRTVFRAPISSLSRNDVSLRLVGDGNEALLKIPTDRGVAGEAGVFSRTLARVMLEFSFKAEYGYDLGMPQWLAQIDNGLSAFKLERLFLGRHKIFHFRSWYRQACAPYVREMLLDSRSLFGSYVNQKGIEGAVNAHLRGTGNYTSEIHQVLTLALVNRLFLGSERGGSPEACTPLPQLHCGIA